MKKTTMLILAVLLSGCGAAAGIQSTLKDRNGELLYLHDSEKVPDKQGGTVQISSFVVDDILPSETTVREKSGFVLPLLVVNVWKFEYQSSLGSDQLKNDYKKFIQDSFIEELDRRGRYKHVEGHGDMELAVEVKTMTMSAPIVKTGNFLFLLVAWAFGQNTSAGPVSVVVTANVELKKDGKELFNRDFQGKTQTNILAGQHVNLEDFTTSMIEGVSLAIKDLDERIVSGINNT